MKEQVTISPELKERTEKAISASRKYNELKRRKNEYMCRGKYFEAMHVAKQMDELAKDIAEELVRKVYRERLDVREILDTMEERDRVEVMVALNTVVFCTDLVETCVMTANEIIQRYRPDCKIEVYDKLIAAGKEASKHMKYVGMDETLHQQELFADMADEITDAVFEGVGKYIRMKQEMKEGGSHEGVQG